MSKQNGAAVTGQGASYRQRKRERAEESGKIYKITSPTGFDFFVQDVDLSLFAVSGALPTAVGEKMEKGKSKGLSDLDAFSQLSMAEKDAGFKFSKRLLKAFCVNPRIVDDPQNDDELAIEELEPEDFEFLIKAATGGDRLDSFRSERDESAASESGGEILQNKTERTAGNKK